MVPHINISHHLSLDLEGIASGIRNGRGKVIAGICGRNSIAQRRVILVEPYAVAACVGNSIPNSPAGEGSIPLSVGRCGQSNLADGFLQRDRAETVRLLEQVRRFVGDGLCHFNGKSAAVNLLYAQAVNECQRGI